MDYYKTIKYLESLINYENISDWNYKKSLELQSFKVFLNNINNPQNAFQSIHIAGSKGKGSTCAFISYILREAGYRVGLYTSPHLADFRERIRVLSRPARANIFGAANPPNHKNSECFEGKISKRELADLVERLKPSIEKYNRISKYAALSFFEVYTALAFSYFKEKKIDFAVIETGLGGRLDATNVVNSLVCAIAPISYEHTQKLGNTLKEIAGEKAGIIKRPQSPRAPEHQLIVITAPQENEALAVIKSRCRKVGAKLFEVGKDITYRREKNGFRVNGISRKYSNLKMKLLGGHQLMNVSAAIGVIEGLSLLGVDVGADSIRKGIYNTLWPGRCEVVSKCPRIVLDGAQNTASIQVLKQAVKEEFKYRKLILILGISNDKDKKGICRQLYDFVDEVILTQADNPRATSPFELAKYFTGKNILIAGNVRQARSKALDIAKKGDLILITGSLFVVGEARQLCKI